MPCINNMKSFLFFRGFSAIPIELVYSRMWLGWSRVVFL